MAYPPTGGDLMGAILNKIGDLYKDTVAVHGMLGEHSGAFQNATPSVILGALEDAFNAIESALNEASEG